MIKKISLAVVVSAAFIITYSLTNDETDIHTGEVFGTYYRITTDKENEIMPAIKQEFKIINDQLSVFTADSELNEINNARADEEVLVSPRLGYILKKSKELTEKTNGYFDPSTGKLVDLWGFGVDYNKNQPSEEEIAKAITNIGMDKLEIDGNKVKKATTDFYLNLSAIAKGYAVDRVSKLLKDMGYDNYLIDIGGEVFVRGDRKLFEQGWNIGIKDPSTKEIATIVNLSDIGVATSGDYEKFIEIEGNKYSHTINPKTGMPTSTDLASVTVFYDDTMTADAIATALMVMGVDKGLEFANENKIMAVFFVYENGVITQIKSNKTAQFWNEIKPRQ